MIMSIRSPSRNAGHVCRRHSDDHASARTNSLLVQQNDRSILASLAPERVSANTTGMLRLRNRSTSRLAPACTRHARRSNPHS